ncbi:hypothetical protein K504DRAFT_371176 [Pleomassaria siparia CBS 279.74]|uniref:LisH domain-containing protein n=1 Tax=Pleomassaria siparia CBS 279.74 TaxID=1314801 RepID=A0A6G1KMG4_9PLEO|nr:hypothetical protein K504DRAFT_371176 [Pleomassaria siparia CBS 279.74]
MAAMNANVGGPVDGTPIMGNMQRPGRPNGETDPRERLNTYIYDYFLRNNHARLARSMLECDLKMTLKPTPTKPSPSGRNVNGVDSMDQETRDGLPEPQLPEGQLADNSFLLDWWVQFWDIFNAARKKQPSGEKGTQYITHTRNLTQMHNEQRNQRMIMANNAMGASYQQMMRAMPNGNVANNEQLKRAAMNNRNPNGNPMNMQMKNQAMLSAQMQRDSSGMDMNGQRPQSPGSSENAPSPNKRQRVEGGMNAGNMPGNQFSEFAQAQNVQHKSIEVYAQSLATQHRIALNNHAMAQGMNSGVQGSPMNQQGLDGQHDMFAGNQQRPGMPAAPGQPQGNHALQDYQMQLMLLEQQNKKRLLMARQEQDSMSGGPHAQPAGGAPGFAQNMSPQGSRAGPSPNPVDQMAKRTPKMNQPGLPGSPMPEGAMQQQRSSPAPNMGFDPTQMPPGMPPQYYNPQMQQNPMMRPPSSHPGGFNGQQMNPQQMEQMRQSGMMPNGGAWRQGPPGMIQQGQQLGPMGNNPPQRNMPPPPAPAVEQSRAQEPSPSQPAAPPTPNQGNKANPKKKATKNDNKKSTKAKGSGATPAASGDEPPTPTPSTPVTAHHPKGFGQNGQQQAGQPPSQPQSGAQQQQQPPMDPVAPFGEDLNATAFGMDLSFETEFDFDSFLHVGDDAGGLNTFGGDFSFGDGVEAGMDN